MKILYLHQYFLTPSKQGATRSYEIARRLVEWGHEVHMITTDTNREQSFKGWRETIESGIHVHWLPVHYDNRLGFFQRLVAFLKFAFSSSFKASQIGGDVVFATSTPLTIALPAVWASRRLGVPMVFEIRDIWPDVPIAMGILKNPILIWAARWLERFAYQNSSHVIGLSPRMAQAVTDTGYPKTRVSVVPNGSDLALFQVGKSEGEKFRKKHAWLGSRPMVAYTGSISPVTNCEYIVRLAHYIYKKNPEICFVMIGEGRDIPKVKALATELGIYEKNFYLLPAIPKSEVPQVLAAADLSLATMADIKILWESASENKFFDSLAAGVPVCVNYRGWIAEMLDQTGAGLALDPFNTEAAAEKVLKAMSDSAWMNKARAAALKLAQERFSRDLLVKDVNRILIAAHEEGKARSHISTPA